MVRSIFHKLDKHRYILKKIFISANLVIWIIYLAGCSNALTDQPSGDQPSGDQPSGDQPSGDQPSGDQPSGDQPSGYTIIKLDDWVSDSIKRDRKMINLLNKYGAKASIGLIGKTIISDAPNILSEAIATGHEIGNHSFSHPGFDQLSAEEIREEILKTNNIFKSKLNLTLFTFFPPYNSIHNLSTIEAVIEVFMETNIKYIYLHNKNFRIKEFEEHGIEILQIGCAGARGVLTSIPGNVRNHSKYVFTFSVNEYELKQPLLCVAQIHPKSWDSTSYDEFEKMLVYFVENKVKFITPREYFTHIRPSLAD